MNRTVLFFAITPRLAAAADSAFTYLVAFPRAIPDAKASFATDEQAHVADATTKAVQAQLGDLTAKSVAQVRAEERARDHDAVLEVVENLRESILPLRHGMTIGQHRAVLLRNAAAIAAVDITDCPFPFQEVNKRASDAVSG